MVRLDVFTLVLCTHLCGWEFVLLDRCDEYLNSCMGLFMRVISRVDMYTHANLILYTEHTLTCRPTWWLISNTLLFVVITNCCHHRSKSIHPSSYAYLGSVTAAAGSAGCSRCFSPQQRFPAPPGGSRGVPGPEEMCNLSSEFWVASQLAPRRILISFPGHSNWLFLNVSSGSTLSSLQMSELLLTWGNMPPPTQTLLLLNCNTHSHPPPQKGITTLQLK